MLNGGKNLRFILFFPSWRLGLKSDYLSPKEKTVVLEEVVTLEYGEINKIDNAFYAHGYPQSPYGFPIGGQSEEVSLLERDNVVQNMINCHLRQGMAVALVGCIDGTGFWEAVVKTIDRASHSLTAPPIAQLPEATLQPGSIGLPSNLESTYFLCGYAACNRIAEERVNLYGASLFLGNDNDSLLFRSLRRDVPLVPRPKSFDMFSGNLIFYTASAIS